MSRLLVYRNRVGTPVVSLQRGAVFESGGCSYIKIDITAARRFLSAVEGELGQPVINLSSFELEFMDEDERVMPVETAKLNIT